MSTATTVITLSLDETADCPSGTATTARGESRAFHGWLGLAAAIQALAGIGSRERGAPSVHTASEGEQS